jgi:hypothetical protein
MKIISGGERMREHKCILSEKPDALDGALEWLQEEIRKMESSSEKKKRVTKELEDDVRPFVRKVAEQRGLVSKK